MSEWIELNLPWNVRLDGPNSPPYPDMNEKIKAHFGKDRYHLEEEMFPGTHTDGIGFVTEHPIWNEYQNICDELLADHTDDEVKELLNQSDNEAVKTVLAYRTLYKKINNWIDDQPEIIEWSNECKRLHQLHKEVQSKLSFCGQGLNRAGTVIEFEENEKLQQMMIGTINELGGVCDDCSGINNKTIILRYRIVWRSELE